MEEDIKILEEYIENLFKYGDRELLEKENIVKCIEYKEIQAIENLLKRYKELEEEVESQDKTIDKLVEEQEEREIYTHSLEEENKTYIAQLNGAFDRGFIPISVIQKYKEKFMKDSKNEEVFMTQSSQINASLISFCNELLKKE